MQSYKEIIEASRTKTPEELTSYLVQRLEESHANFPFKFSSNINKTINEEEAWSIQQVIQAVNEELWPDAYSSSGELHFEGLSSLDEFTPQQIVRLLVSSPGLRECMYNMGRCSITEFITTVQKTAPPKSVCGKVLNSEQAYRCFDCQHDDSSIFCMDCFEPEKHVGHKYFITVANGVCDCGDANALATEGFCSRHKGVDPNEDMHKYYPECYKETTRAVLRAMCRYAIVHIGDDANHDDVRSVFLCMYILVRKLGYGFGSMLGDAMCEVHADLMPRTNRYIPFVKYAEEFKDQQFAKSLLWLIVFYNDMIPEGTRVFINKVLFEMISVYDFKAKFTVVFIGLHKWIILWSAGIYPEKANKEYVDAGGDLDVINGDEEEPDGYDFEEECDDDDLTIRHFSVQLISSKGSCQKTLDDLSFYKAVFEGWSEILSRALPKKREDDDDVVTPFIDIKRIGEEVALSFIHGCYDLRYALQQVDNAGTDIFFRTAQTDGIIASMYRALSMIQGAFPNKLNMGEFTETDTRDLNAMLQIMLCWTTPQGDMITGLKTLTPSEKEHVVGRALLEMWHQMCDVHTSYIDCPHKEVPAGSTTQYSIVDYDITTRGASLVTILNTLTTQFVMEALSEFDDVEALFQSANAGLRGCGYGDKEVTPAGFAQAFLEAPLRALACCGQIEAGHWVRNGENLIIFEVLSRRKVDVSYRLGMNDLLSLQLCAALMPRDLFVHTVLDRFGVGDTHPAALGDRPVRPAVVYSALETLLLVALEKWYLPRADPVAATRHTMVQLLASEAAVTYQSGRELCGPLCEKHYDEVLKSIAERVDGKYRLVDGLWDTEVTPYFFFCTSAMLGDLLENYEIHLKRNKRPVQSLPCPKVASPPDHPLFRGLPRLLAARPIHALIAQALCTSKFSEEDDSNPPESQVYVLPCLHIMYLCLTSGVVCPDPSDADAVVEEALRDVGGTCTAAVLCKIHRKYSENEALTAAILRLLAARNPACRAAAESAFEALGAPGSFQFDVSPAEKSGEKAKRRENRKKHQNNAMSKLRAKQFAFLKNMEAEDDDENGGAAGEESDVTMAPAEGRDEKDGTTGADGNDGSAEDDTRFCVFCHGREGRLGRMGYAQKSDLLSRIDEVSQDSVVLGNSLPAFSEDNANSMLEFLANGLHGGIYMHLCKHWAHSVCLSKYISAGAFAQGTLLDKKLLQYSCPACMRLSNIFLSDEEISDGGLFVPLCYVDNGEENILPKQKMFYLLCRALGYTSASYELAARSAGPIAAYLTQERSGLLSTLLLNARNAYELLDITEEEDEDGDPDVHRLLEALITPEPSEILSRIHGRTLFSVDTFNVFVMYMATLGKTDKVDGAFILNLLIAEMCKVRSAIASSQKSPSGSEGAITVGQVAKYCVPFLRRVLTMLASTNEAYKGILAGVSDEYDFYALVALLKLPRLPIISSSFAGAPVDEALEAPGCSVAADFFEYLEGSNLTFVSKTTPVNEEDRFRLVFSQAKPFHLTAFKPSIERMIMDYSKTVCPRCKTRPKYPTVCLICGEFVCPFSKCCDHECNRHAKECVKTCGFFYNITVNYVVYFRSDHKLGTLYNSPYVDR